MRTALAHHDDLVRAAVEGHGDQVVKSTEDGALATFRTASDGVGAAVDAQGALCAATWPDGLSLRVRMGLHTGEATQRDGDWFGSDVNRAARVVAVAHGGQILCTGAVGDQVRERVGLIDLGEHRVRGGIRHRDRRGPGTSRDDVVRRRAGVHLRRDRPDHRRPQPSRVGTSRRWEKSSIRSDGAPMSQWEAGLGSAEGRDREVTVGKNEKRKQRLERHRDDVEAALASVSVTTSTAFAAHLFDRIHAEATGRLEQILGETQREAAAFVDALADTLADSRVAAREGADEITLQNRDVLESCAGLRAEAEHDRAEIRAVLIEMQATADDVETRARAHVEDVRSRGGASLARLEETWTEASRRLEASQRAIDEQVRRFGEQVAGRVTWVATEADRAVQRFARSGVENIADATAEDPIWGELARPPLTSELDPEADPDDDENFFSRLAAELRVETNEDATQG
jgi:hypothetical protein